MNRRPRKYIPYPERLASALACLLPQEQRDDLRARKVPARVVLALFDQDHVILHALGGTDDWWNITPRLRAEHREKSRRDTAVVAKVKRIARKNAPIDYVSQHGTHTWADGCPICEVSREPIRPKRSIASRPFQKGHRPMRRRLAAARDPR
jgi:hypothetical protein